MIDWEDIISAENEDELKTAKIWLFQENMRLENERKNIDDKIIELEKRRTELKESENRFENDKEVFREEMKAINKKTSEEREKLKQDTIFFNKKMEILTEGFRSLDADRQAVERDKRFIESEKRLLKRERENLALLPDNSDLGEILFRGAGNGNGAKKRYKELLKIFHPDNMAGDDELAQIIVGEFNRRGGK
ncbi:MAG: hypothetical protein IJ608_08240 [Lachnospiraceae bacterium]|nr:hypothetical protein [Lachnospiraceae bacterium]